MKYKYITSIVVVVVTLSISIISIVIPDKEISELEARELQEVPLPNKLISEDFNRNAYIYELLTGDMFKKWDNYFSDHILNRDKIVSAYTAIQEILDKKYVNGAFLGKDDYIFSTSTVMGVSNEDLKNSADYFNDFANKFKNSETYIVNLPSKSMVYEDKMPIDNYVSPDNEYIDEVLSNIDNNVNVLDFRSIISSDEDLYYKTDHHWNMTGTYKAYNYIINNIEKKFEMVGRPKSKDEFDIEIYEKYFVGTDGRKVAQLVKDGENIEIYNNEDMINYKVRGRRTKDKLIHREYLSEEKLNNDYDVYLASDNPEVIVENMNSNNDLKIVMIGDSMDNPLVPLMAFHFREIYSYDLRYYKEDIISKIDQINPDIIMLIGLSEHFIKGENSRVLKWNI